MKSEGFIEGKRLNGQYFTRENPFETEGFKEWAEECNLKGSIILEPFAGSNNLITILQKMDLVKDFASFDVSPQNENVLSRDTLKDFPKGYNVCITNPPYLARNSAKRRKLPYPETQYDDLYKFAIEKALHNCKNVGAIIPASFLNSGLFKGRLSRYILLNNKMFDDTSHPVCLALFKESSSDVWIHENKEFIGKLSELEKKLPSKLSSSAKKFQIKFNEKSGNLGLIGIDNTLEPSIKFCSGSEINPEKILGTSRSITRISIDCDTEKLIKNLNEALNSFRKETHDIFLTPFKGLRKDFKYRRRLDYKLARDLINQVLSEI
jgi:hypothetical protein